MTLHPPSLLHILSGGYTLSSYNPPSQKKPGVTCLRLYCPLLSQLGMCRAYRSSRGPRLSLKGILDILSRIWSSSCWHWVLKKEQKQQQQSRTGGPYGDIWVCSSHQVGKLSCSYSNFCRYKKKQNNNPTFYLHIFVLKFKKYIKNLYAQQRTLPGSTPRRVRGPIGTFLTCYAARKSHIKDARTIKPKGFSVMSKMNHVFSASKWIITPASDLRFTSRSDGAKRLVETVISFLVEQ